MGKKLVENYKWVYCLLLLVWISKTSVAQLEDDSAEDFRNDGASADDTLHARNADLDLDEKQHALKRILHEQLEHVTHAELVEGRNGEHASRPNQKLDSYSNDENSEEDRDEDDEDEEEADEEEEREYNPWQDSFQDQYEDGSYVFGYSLPNGVTRYERSYYSDEDKGRVVEGFHTEPRFFGKRHLYELRCYRADYYHGYKAFRVQYLRRPPIVRRDETPNVNCFKKD